MKLDITPAGNHGQQRNIHDSGKYGEHGFAYFLLGKRTDMSAIDIETCFKWHETHRLAIGGHEGPVFTPKT